MLLTLIIILILIWAAVIWSIYSNFVVFHSNFSESENYHKAYYASISALERWELVTKQRSPWYVWSGWFKKWIWTGSLYNPDWWSDKSLSEFSYLWDNANVSSVFRTINSRTTRIPAEWKWDVERMLSANDSSGYNMMGYENSEVFLLYYDNWKNNPYQTCQMWDIEQSHPDSINWIIRLPQLLYLSWKFGDLDTAHPLIWAQDKLSRDDAIVDWQIRGFIWADPFTIYSTQKKNFDNNIDYSHDSIFRESDINSKLSFIFWHPTSPSKWDTISSSSDLSNLHWDHTEITVISKNAYNLATLSNSFRDIFTDINTRNTSLRFSLLNLLRTSTSGSIYPFLEYYADFWTNVSDKYYTINWEWNFKDYQVNIIIQKPTVKESVLSNFTSIF